MNLYVWGTGCGAADFLKKGIPEKDIKAFVDNQPVKKQFLNWPVITPQQLCVSDVGLMVITCQQAEQIYKQCLLLGLSDHRLFFTKNQYVLKNRNAGCTAAEEYLGMEYLRNIIETCQIVRESSVPGTQFLANQEKANDFVRLRTLELLADEIKDVPGAVAELGVYRGAFASCLNQIFSDRSLYLFDTFQGFDSSEAEREAAFLEAHQNTSLEAVLKRMPYPEKILVRQGLFPQSAIGLEESFALVSLDVDFEASTFAGLSWFWPRLCRGGYLLIHDYNSSELSGVKRAVKRFESQHNILLPGIPLCDINGSFIIHKV